MEENKIELRKLKVTDLVPLAKILTKIGFKEFKGCLSSDTMSQLTILMNDEGNNDNVGVMALGVMAFDIIAVILENLERCEDDLYNFLASLRGMTRKEFNELDIEEIFYTLKALVKLPQFADFFNQASKLVK